MSNYIQGDTVRLQAKFYSWAGVLEDRTGVTVKIYDSGRVQIGTAISGASVTKDGTGIYSCKYVLPAGYSDLIYEFSGLDSEGLTHLSRASISPIFAV